MSIKKESEFGYMKKVKETANERYSVFNAIHTTKKPDDEKKNWYKYRPIELRAPVFICKHQAKFNPWTTRNEGLEDVNEENYDCYMDENGEYFVCKNCSKK